LVRAFGKLMLSTVHVIELCNILFHVTLERGGKIGRFLTGKKARVVDGNCMHKTY